MFETGYGRHFHIMEDLGITIDDLPDEIQDEGMLTFQIMRLMKDLYREFLRYYEEEGECNVYCKIFNDKKYFGIFEDEFLRFVYDVFATAVLWLLKDQKEGKIDINTAPHEEIAKYLDRAYEYQVKKNPVLKNKKK